MDKDSIILILCSLGIAQGLFLCGYLLSLKKGNVLGNQLLSLILIGLILRVGKSILHVYIDLSPWQRNMGLGGILLVGPSLWWYGKVLLLKLKILPKSAYLHFIPFGLFELFCWLIPNDGQLWAYLTYYAVFAHLAVHIVLAIRILKFGSPLASKVAIRWFRNLIIGVGLIWFFYIGNILGIVPFYIGGALFFSFLVYVFSFLMLKQHTFTLEKYLNTTVDPKEARLIINKLERLFTTEATYLQPNMNLASVAEQLQVTPRALSQAINEVLHMNFSEYVNSHRITKAKQLLVHSDYAEEKIATIAYDVGFNNPTSFNIAFKAITKITPTQYKKGHIAAVKSS